MDSVGGKSFSQSLNETHFLGGLCLHFPVAVVGSMVIGFLPEAFISRYDGSRQWHTGLAHSRLDFITANFFGPTSKCSDTECLDELFVTTPFAATVGYSLGAAFGLRSYRNSQRTIANINGA